MLARSSRFALSAIFLSGCASAPPPPAPPAPPPPPVVEEPVVVETPQPIEASSDPNVVRCGIDDRPRAILGRVPAGPAGAARAKVVAEQVAPPMPQPGVTPAPRPRVVLKVEPPRASGGHSLAPKVSSALTSSIADFDGCEPFATPDDESKIDLAMSLSSGGAPLRVLPPTKAKPSVYVRCLMERACQLRGGEDAAAADLVLPVVITWNYPRLRGKAPAATEGVTPRVFFEARPDLDASPSAFTRTVRQITRQAVRTCVGVVAEASVRITLKLSKAKSPRVVGTTITDLSPGVPQGIEECVHERMKTLTLAERPDGFAADELALVVAW